MFSIIYQSCLKNLTLLRVSSGSSSEGKESMTTTLGEVVDTSRYLFFCLLRGSSFSTSESGNSTTGDFLSAVQQFTVQKNGLNGSHRGSTNGSSPTKLKRLFGGLKMGRKSTASSSSTSTTENKGNAAMTNLCIATILIDVESTSPPLDLNLFGVFQQAAGTFLLQTNLQKYNEKRHLLRALSSCAITPALIVVDARRLAVLTTQGRRWITDDPSGDEFPWTDPSIIDVFEGKFLRNTCENSPKNNAESRLSYTSEVVEFSELKPCVKGLYFGAKWCPPCRVLSKQLADIYERLKAKLGDQFEIFFCSADRSEASFRENFATMPWCAFSYNAEKSWQLSRTFQITGIPSLVLLDADDRLLSRNARSVLFSDPDGDRFPWRPAAITELSEFTVHQIGECVSLILFTEGSPEDNEFSQSILRPVAEDLFVQRQKWQSVAFASNAGDQNHVNNSDNNAAENENHRDDNFAPPESENPSSTLAVEQIPNWADPIQVFYTGDDPICDHILESLGLGEADLPLLTICDVISGHMAICERPDVSAQIVAEFVADYRNGCAKVMPLSTSTERRVGGIPVNLIEQLMISQQNQQQFLNGEDRTPTSPAAATSIGSPQVL